MTTTHAAVSDALDRLGDLDNDIWSRDEMELYLQDRYDEFCRRSKALFDIVVIENLPPVGNWQTDLERYLALQMPGLAVTDGPFHFTDDSERNLSGGPSDVGGTYRGPAGITNPNQRQYADDDEIDSVPTTVLGGYLPQSTVEVLRVAYDNRDLLGLGSQQMRRIDPNYETREGDPQFFTYDKDGLFFLRVVPAASGDATYPTTNGGFGTVTQEVEESTNTVFTNILNYYPMEETTGNRYDLITGTSYLTASGTVTSDTGVQNNAAKIAAGPGSSLIGTLPVGNKSVSFWVKFDSVSGTQNVVYFGSPGTSLNRVGTNFRLTASGGGVLTTGTVTVTTGTWYHIVYTLDDAGNTSNVYVDGTLDITSANTETDTSLTFQGDTDGAIYIDEVATFSTVLTAAEAATLAADLFYGEVANTTVTQEITGSGTGGYGILRYRSGDDDSAMFPSGGPWGSPTRIHPTEGNIKVEVTRLGRSLATHGIELPPAYTKYVIFGAMARALRRDGPGQDIALADHYDQRFEQGLERITGKLNKMSPERVGRFRQPGRPDEFGLGLPIMPSAYENPWR